MEGKTIIAGRHAPPTRAEGPFVSWSRRRLLRDGILPLGLLSVAAAAAAAAPALGRTVAVSTGEAGGATGPASHTGSGAVRSATDANNRLTTVVQINGRGPYRFLVDTGAERTLIADEIAAQLDLPRGRQVIVEGIIRGQPAALVRVVGLRMGTLVSPSLEAPVLPRAMMGADGYLGLDVLDNHRVVLDFQRRTLTVEPPEGFFAALWQRGNEAIVHTLGSSGRLRATDCRVNGIRAAAFLDTGAEVSVANPALYAALLQDAPNRQVAGGPVHLYGVTGGTMVGLGTNVDDITLDALHLTYTPLVVAPLEVFDVWGLSREPALLLGMDCLRRFARVSIDYGRQELRFEVASSQIAPPLQAGLPPPLRG